MITPDDAVEGRVLDRTCSQHVRVMLKNPKPTKPNKTGGRDTAGWDRLQNVPLLL